MKPGDFHAMPLGAERGTRGGRAPRGKKTAHAQGWRAKGCEGCTEERPLITRQFVGGGTIDLCASCEVIMFHELTHL